MERRKQITEAAITAERTLFAARCRLLEKEYRKGRYREEALNVFEQLLCAAVKQQKEIYWLGISILNTSLMTESYEFLLSLYGREFYFDPEPLETYWKPPLFAQCFQEDIGLIMNTLRKQFPRIWKYEEDCVRKVCMEYYHAAFGRLCMDLGDEIRSTEAFRQAVAPEQFKAFFGYYHGEGEILWHTGEE